jgi:transglutaminase-like putative cysteine protease
MSLGPTWRDAQAFDQLMPLVPFQGQCLFRSRLLLAFLRTADRDATWVFGVRTRPFQAHCWLQVHDTALDDAAERICGYTPILAL